MTRPTTTPTSGPSGDGGARMAITILGLVLSPIGLVALFLIGPTFIVAVIVLAVVAALAYAAARIGWSLLGWAIRAGTRPPVAPRSDPRAYGYGVYTYPGPYPAASGAYPYQTVAPVQFAADRQADLDGAGWYGVPRR